MSPDEARAFYAMTNSVPHSGALWLEGSEMERWIAPAARSIPTDIESTLRLALARSAQAVTGRLATAVRTPWAAPVREPEAEVAAPRLAYAAMPAALLDSLATFP